MIGFFGGKLLAPFALSLSERIYEQLNSFNRLQMGFDMPVLSLSKGSARTRFGQRFLAQTSLPHCLKQTDTGGYGYVQAFDTAGHGDGHETVATLARQAAHALAFCAQHDR
jgi:hypothetical protein